MERFAEKMESSEIVASLVMFLVESKQLVEWSDTFGRAVQ